MKNPIVHFEIPVDDVERANAFYRGVFDWRIEAVDMPDGSPTGGEPYYMVYTAEVDEQQRPKIPGAINGGLMKRVNSGQVFCNYVAVESIDATLEQVRQLGGEVLMPRTEIAPGMGFIATFNDPEGNQMGLYEFTAGEGGE